MKNKLDGRLELTRRQISIFMVIIFTMTILTLGGNYQSKATAEGNTSTDLMVTEGNTWNVPDFARGWGWDINQITEENKIYVSNQGIPSGSVTTPDGKNRMYYHNNGNGFGIGFKFTGNQFALYGSTLYGNIDDNQLIRVYRASDGPFEGEINNIPGNLVQVADWNNLKDVKSKVGNWGYRYESPVLDTDTYIVLIWIPNGTFIGAQVRSGNPSDATGRTYYVSPNGSDDWSGSTSLPWRTLLKAGSMLRAGDTLNIKAGTYGTKDLDGDKLVLEAINSGKEDKPVTIKAAPGETVHIKGKGQWGQLIRIGQNTKYITLSGLNIEDTTGATSAIYTDSDTSHITITDCTFKNNSVNFIRIDDGSYWTISNCSFDTTGSPSVLNGWEDAIYSNGSNHLLIENNQFTKCANYAISLRPRDGSTLYSSNCVIRGNDIDQGWGGGIACITGSHDNLIENNTIKNTGIEEGDVKFSGILAGSEDSIYRNNVITNGKAGNRDYYLSKITDGDYNTGWISPFLDKADWLYKDHWVKIDLGEVKTIDTVYIRWGVDHVVNGQTVHAGPFPKFNITLSDDNGIKMVTPEKTGIDGTQAVSTGPVQARYITVSSLNSATGECGIGEIYAYNFAESPPANFTYGKTVTGAEIMGAQDDGINLNAYGTQNCRGNRVYNNVVYNNGGYAVEITQGNDFVNTKVVI